MHFLCYVQCSVCTDGNILVSMNDITTNEITHYITEQYKPFVSCLLLASFDLYHFVLLFIWTNLSLYTSRFIRLMEQRAKFIFLPFIFQHCLVYAVMLVFQLIL